MPYLSQKSIECTSWLADLFGFWIFNHF